MYEFLTDRTTMALAPSLGCEPGSPTYEKLRYGTHTFYINAAKTLLLTIIALLLGIMQYVAIFALAYGGLRLFSFGMHFKSTLICTFVGLVYYLGSTYLSLFVTIPIPLKVTVVMVCGICFMIYAPAETKKRPILSKQRKKFKVKSIIVFLVIVVSIFMLYPFSTIYSNLLFMAIICQTVNILPITYRIEGLKINERRHDNNAMD